MQGWSRYDHGRSQFGTAIQALIICIRENQYTCYHLIIGPA